MEELWVCFFVICAIFFGTDGFSLETDFPIIYHDPFRDMEPNVRSSYFGFSVIMFARGQEKPWIQVGAPRASSNRLVDTEPGMLVRCGIYGGCTRIHVDKDPSGWINYNGIALFENKNKAWIGGVMDISLDLNKTITCGHRWIEEKIRYNQPIRYNVRGACYWSSIYNSGDYSPTSKIVPLMNYTHDPYTEDGQLGISVQFTRNKIPELIAGVPGVGLWSGSMMRIRGENSPHYFTNFLTTSYRVPNEFSLNGYAVTSGYYFGKGELIYVSSAPRNNYFGQVILFTFFERSDLMKILNKQQGQQFGEYFGASLATGDINNDNFEDLIIGAPYFSSRDYNEGRVYVFLGSEEKSLKKPLRGHLLTGEVAQGQFGLSVAFLGDLDKDGFGDVAVAAPYADDRGGIVYIFMGGRQGLYPDYTQKIFGKNVDPAIKGFGISFAKPADVDHNHYDDVTIGAYLSGHTVLLRNKNSIALFLSVDPHKKQIEKEDDTISLRICHYFLSRYPPPNITIERRISVDDILGRGRLKERPFNTVTIQRLKKSCENVTIELVDKSLRYNLFDPLTVSVSHKLVVHKPKKQVINIFERTHFPTKQDKFDRSWSVHDVQKSILNWTELIPFALDCKNKNICLSKLGLQARFINIRNGNRYILGSEKSTKLEVIVENSGENAYFTQILLAMPAGIYLRHKNTTCDDSADGLLCLVDNPLVENGKKYLYFDFDTEEINLGRTEHILTFNMTLTTNSKNLNEGKFSVDLILVREADIELTGVSNQEELYFKPGLESINFTHSLRVQKYQASRIDEVEFRIGLPVAFKESPETKFLEYQLPNNLVCRSSLEPQKFSARKEDYDETNNVKTKTKIAGRSRSKRESLDNKPIELSCLNKTFECIIISCQLGPYTGTTRNAISDIQITMTLNISKFDFGEVWSIFFTANYEVDVLDPKDFIQTGSRPDLADISTYFASAPVEKQIGLWVYILGIILGLAILALLIFLLVRIGFFKRSHKHELQNLKKEEAARNECCEQNAVKFEEVNEETVIYNTEDTMVDQMQEPSCPPDEEIGKKPEEFDQGIQTDLDGLDQKPNRF